VPKSAVAAPAPDDLAERKKLLQLPEENLLYFIEKTAPKLETWQREILRIVRNLAQYFYPQKQTKVMNEGCATFVHYNIMHRLHETGGLSDGVMLEMLHAHTSVIAQPDFDDKRFTSLNPYALGFGMMCDIARIATAPTEEDRTWFPAFAGNGDPWGTLRGVWADYRDESFVLQFLSPHLMRKMKLFAIRNDPNDSDVIVTAIHDEQGYRDVRKTLAQCYDIATIEPDIQVVDVDLAGDRRLILHHRVLEGATIEADDARRVLQHIANIWGYPVLLVEIDAATETIIREHEPVEPAQSLS
jgi:spore cortex formation protein SpoVR/YcgB (stage V sporulation)